MADNMSIEQVAERFLRMKGIKKPDKPAVIAPESPQAHGQLISEAYDLIVEKEDLKGSIVRLERDVMEPMTSVPLTLDQKRELIRQGKTSFLLSDVGREPFNEIVGRSQTRINAIDERMNQIFQTSGTFEKFREDLSRQVRVRHEARNVQSSDRFIEQIDLSTLKLTRKAQVQGRNLTTAERGIIQDNKILKQDAIQKKQELLKDSEVFDRVRILELKKYRDQLDRKNGRFATPPSRIAYVKMLEDMWSEDQKVLLTGSTGTGKTELVRYASEQLFGKLPFMIRGGQDMNAYKLLGTTGLEIKKDEGSDVPRYSELLLAMGVEDGVGGVILYDEMNATPNKANLDIKELLNRTPGQKVREDVGHREFTVGRNFALAATANIKGEKHLDRYPIGVEISRIFRPLPVDYIPPHEVYDLALASLMDKYGRISLSENDARILLKNLCDSASWIQDAYLGRKIVTDPSGKFLEARGQAATGKVASLQKALLDPGTTLDMLKGWSVAQIKDISFEEYLNGRIVEFIRNEDYPEEDRYYLAEIFALKGFLKGVNIAHLSVPGLTQAVLDRWSGGGNTGKRQQQLTPGYLTADRVARLDPYRRFMRPVDVDAADMLDETEATEEGRSPISESSDYFEARKIMGSEFFGPDEVEKAFGFEIDQYSIPEIPFSTQELTEARANGQYLMLYVPKKADKTLITARILVDTLQEQFDRDGKGKIQYTQDWYQNENSYTTDAPRAAWRLIAKEVVPGSLDHNYLQQTEDIVKYLKDTVFKGRSVPADYQDAINEFERQKNDLRKNLSSSWQDSANKLAGLKLTQMTRQTFVEERYAWLVYFQNRNTRLLENRYTWTGSQASAGRLVLVGLADAKGAYVGRWRPENSAGDLGVVFSR